MIRNACMTAVLALTLTGCEEKRAEAPVAPTDAPAAAAPSPPAGAGAKEAPADGMAAKGTGSAAQANAKAIFAQRCTLCHGLDGKGTGPAAANLNPKPRDYSDAKWQAGVTDELLAKTIVEGGAAVGKSMMMPPNPDLKDKPEVVTELVHLIRAFKK